MNNNETSQQNHEPSTKGNIKAAHRKKGLTIPKVALLTTTIAISGIMMLKNQIGSIAFTHENGRSNNVIQGHQNKFQNKVIAQISEQIKEINSQYRICAKKEVIENDVALDINEGEDVATMYANALKYEEKINKIVTEKCGDILTIEVKIET